MLHPYGYAQIGKLHFDPHSNRDHRDPTNTSGFDPFILSDEPGCYDDAYTKWVENLDPSQLKGVRTTHPPAAYEHDLPNYSDVGRETHEPYDISRMLLPVKGEGEEFQPLLKEIDEQAW